MSTGSVLDGETAMRAALTMLSGAVAAPPPLPFRPPKRDGDMPWAEAVDRHRHRLATERAALRTPWDAGRVAEADRKSVV